MLKCKVHFFLFHHNTHTYSVLLRSCAKKINRGLVLYETVKEVRTQFLVCWMGMRKNMLFELVFLFFKGLLGQWFKALAPNH